MNISNAEFVLGAVEPEQFPDLKLPEVAFAGRSNVGKSSLINSIIKRKNLARISSTPGKTQQINFFNVDNVWSLADLPGFGYAAVSKKMRSKWKKLNMEYLKERQELKLVCTLIDSRHDPMDHDLALIEWLEINNIDYLIVLTKTDKIKKNLLIERKAQIDTFVSQCNHCYEVLPYSCVKETGRKELIAIIKKHTTK